MKTINYKSFTDAINDIANQINLISEKEKKQDIAIYYFLFQEHEIWHDKFKEQLQEHKIILKRLNDESNIKKVIVIIKSIRQSMKREKNLIIKYGEKILKMRKNN
jgi:hypothetical protein